MKASSLRNKHAGSNAGSNQNAFSPMPAEPLSLHAALSPWVLLTAQAHPQMAHLALRPRAELAERAERHK